MTSIRPCPACSSPDSRPWGEKRGFAIVACARCGTTFTTQLPQQEESHDYDRYYQPANLHKPEFLQRRLAEIAATFAPFRREGHLLDVGCGSGEWLDAARGAGWKAEGLEVSGPVVEYLRGQGYDVFHGVLEDAPYADGKFDVVLCIEVLEHVPDARLLLQQIRRILRPGGLLYATTPHGCGLSARVIGTDWTIVAPPEHLQLFSVSGMKKLLGECGFGSSQVLTQGLNPYEIAHALRARRRPQSGEASETSFNRGAVSYQMNEFLLEKPSRRLLKNALNGGLSALRLGDSLKIRAS